MPEAPPRSPMASFAASVTSLVEGPVVWFRGKYFDF